MLCAIRLLSAVNFLNFICWLSYVGRLKLQASSSDSGVEEKNFCINREFKSVRSFV